MFPKEVIHKLPDRKLGIYIYIYIYIFFFFFAAPCSLWDLSNLTRDQFRPLAKCRALTTGLPGNFRKLGIFK